ncbi:ATP-binding cassette domain-containing protein [Pseudarthrobacter sp. PS3-L1]|uniref:sulfate/molybdate ABC transporter ATP-binding protein n=1 Tax=Pseudarthrobacter sp. PS3-L1 TaxID=3046207 RepID=UPI0024BA9B10|nr:ATP-binding cassette domain-containing protein [Pseudarthrobacter sp. PS3-L1]MDJ0321161.1 ATP-binding cassette domain-containing protein [Pseudarthrobacter sp. PS3-L1]
MSLDFNATLSARNFDVSLHLDPGETLAVLGPNGAGKSTLLSVIAGLQRPDSGTATVGGHTLFDLSTRASHWSAPHTRGTVLLAQEPLLFPHLSALDNVAFGPRSAGESKSAARAKALQWLAATETGTLASRKPGQLSGGQAQRVAVARALAAEPELLLLDEPMAALDIHAAPLMRRLLKRVLAGRNAIIITHDVLDVLTLADQVMVLEDGHVSESGPAREVLSRPRSTFAAGLAGLNLVSGTVAGDGITSTYGHVAGMLDAGTAQGQVATAVFPPSAVSVFPDEPHGSPRNTYAVTITDLEPHGDRIRVRAGNLCADITPAASADLALEPGSRVYFLVKATTVSIYPT